MAKCRFLKRDDTPCEARAIGSHSGCWNHDPDFELDRRRNAKRGGKQGGRGRHSPGSADLHRLQVHFERLADRVLQEEVDRADAAVAIQAWNGARACIAASAKVRELEEVERRLDALEQGQKERDVV